MQKQRERERAAKKNDIEEKKKKCKKGNKKKEEGKKLAFTIGKCMFILRMTEINFKSSF
jgi:hypothetical protein